MGDSIVHVLFMVEVSLCLTGSALGARVGIDIFSGQG